MCPHDDRRPRGSCGAHRPEDVALAQQIEDPITIDDFNRTGSDDVEHSSGLVAFSQDHGAIASLGYRFGPIAYSSDVKELDDTAFKALEGVKLWIVDALRYNEHPTHANVATALSWIERVRPERAVLTNLHHDIDYQQLKAQLPKGVEPAYDGMTVEVPFEP